MSNEKPPCPQRERLLQRLLNDDTVAPLSAADETHLRECPTCARSVRAAQKMEGMLAGHFGEIKTSVKPVPPGPALEAEMKPSMPLGPWLIGTGIAALLILGISFSNRSGTPAEPPVQVRPPAASPASESVPVPPVTPKPAQLLLASGRLVLRDGTVLSASNAIPEQAEMVECPEISRISLNEVLVTLHPGQATIRQDRLTLASGRAEVEVKIKGRPFQVLTPTTTVSVLGTRFSVELSRDGETLVGVQDGIVRIETVAGVRKVLGAGGEFRIDAHGQANPPIASGPTFEGATTTTTLASSMGETITTSAPEDDTPAKRPAENWQFLINAASRGQIEMVRRALTNGATPNVRDDEGNTPLHLAARNGHASVVKILLAAGADKTAENKWKETPLALATAQGNEEIVTILK